MQNSSRNEILQRIAAADKRRLACVEPPVSEESIYKPILPDLVACFKNEIEAVNGQCIQCLNESEAFAQLKDFVRQRGFEYLFCRDRHIIAQLGAAGIPFSSETAKFEGMQAGITGCEFLVARTGSVLISSAAGSGRQMIVFPPVHIVSARVSQLVAYPGDALAALQEKYAGSLPSSISSITGPSRTADIEKTLVLGAHGPKELIVFLSGE